MLSGSLSYFSPEHSCVQHPTSKWQDLHCLGGYRARLCFWKLLWSSHASDQRYNETSIENPVAFHWWLRKSVCKVLHSLGRITGRRDSILLWALFIGCLVCSVSLPPPPLTFPGLPPKYTTYISILILESASWNTQAKKGWDGMK